MYNSIVVDCIANVRTTIEKIESPSKGKIIIQ